MKTKLILLAAVVVAGLTASAGVLNWQVASDATTETWATAGIAVYGSEISDHTTAASSAEDYLQNQTATSTATTLVDKQAFDSTYATATDVESYSGKLFYIELYDSNNKVVARSGDYLSFNNGQLVSSASGSTDNFLSTSAFMADAAIWNGGAFVVVPEPTSGLMLLLGAAVLGLRRKRRV